MVDIINHPLIKELEKFEFVDGDLYTVKINGVNEANSEEGYLYGIIQPLYDKFFITDLPKYLGEAGRKKKNAYARNELNILKAKIESIVRQRDVDLTIQSWQTEFSLLDLKKYENRARYHVLKFLLGVTKIQKSFALTSLVQFEKLLQGIETPNEEMISTTEGLGSNGDSQNMPFRFRLCEKYSNQKLTILTDLRNGLIDLRFLIKEDPHNTLGNFRRMFGNDKQVTSIEDAAIPIRWQGNQTELKYFIHIITDVLIEPDYTKDSNYKIAFQKLFVNKKGDLFNPRVYRYKDKPSTAARIDEILGCLTLPDTIK